MRSFTLERRRVITCGLLCVVLTVGLVSSVGARDSVTLGFETRRQYRQWQPVMFTDRDTTAYRYDRKTEEVCGQARSSASGLAVPWPEGRSLDELSVLEWEWKIESTVPGGNARTKEGDDYAARVYVNFQRDGAFDWWERAAISVYEMLYNTSVPGTSLNFIWANELPQGSTVSSPFTERSRMVALQSGNERTGEWVRERVNLRKYYQRVFSRPPTPPHSIALMTDSDNTQTDVKGCYRRIRLRSR